MGLTSELYEDVSGQKREHSIGGSIRKMGDAWRRLQGDRTSSVSFGGAPSSQMGQVPMTGSPFSPLPMGQLTPFNSTPSMTSFGSPSGAQDPDGDIGSESPGSEPGRFRRVGNFLWKNKEALGDLLGAGANAYSAYKQESRADELHKRNRAEWERRKALRDAAMAGLLDESRPDLSSVFAEPEERYRRVNVGSRG